LNNSDGNGNPSDLPIFDVVDKSAPEGCESAFVERLRLKISRRLGRPVSAVEYLGDNERATITPEIVAAFQREVGMVVGLRTSARPRPGAFSESDIRSYLRITGAVARVRLNCAQCQAARRDRRRERPDQKGAEAKPLKRGVIISASSREVP
jgi:hypothetical protein